MDKHLYVYYRCNKYPHWVFDRSLPSDCLSDAERHLLRLSQLHGSACFVVGGTVKSLY